MKFITLLLLVSAPALAVQTRLCPGKLTVSFAGLELTRTLGQVIDERNTVDEAELAKLTAAYLNTQGTRAVTRAMDLDSARNGRCIYRPTTVRETEEKIELYTKNSKDLMMVQTDIAPGGALLRVYSQILSLSNARVTLSDRDAGLALAIPRHPYDTYSAGGELIFIGKVRNITAGTK